MNQVLYTWNIPIHPHIGCICVDASPRAAHYTARGTRTVHGCVPTQTMVLLFLAAPPHCCSAMFRAGAPQCKEYLEIHRNPHHIDSKELLTVGKTRTAYSTILRECSSLGFPYMQIRACAPTDTEEARSRPQKNESKNGFDSATRTIAARGVVKADSRHSRSDLQARSPPTKLLDLAQTYGNTGEPLKCAQIFT